MPLNAKVPLIMQHRVLTCIIIIIINEFHRDASLTKNFRALVVYVFKTSSNALSTCIGK